MDTKSFVACPDNIGVSHNPDVSASANPRHISAAELFWFLAIVGEIALVILVLRELDMQTSAFRRMFYLAGAGFLINHFLPRPWRLPFFGALSIAGIMLVLGGAPEWSWDPVAAGTRTLTILFIGFVLIGICNLPIRFWYRVILLVSAGALIACFRTGLIPNVSFAAVWPVVAGMFMFRLFIYLYDLSNMKQRPPLSCALAYFFVLPNVCVTLFPVIDFKTFTKSHYAGEPLEIYQRGVRWMTRGVIQLVVYRLIDQLFSLQPEYVANGTDLIQFLITNLFLYLKISGLFHLVIGLLLLFGFNLPETNHRYFLAASFSDYWRRVNIYWKDFMMKVFYYPAFFKIKKWGTSKALVLSTLFTFFITWVLHAYQTWWLKGSASVTLPDVLFWSLLALLVLANSFWEMKRGNTARLGIDRNARTAGLLMLKTAGTFTCICVLWSLWRCSTVSQWMQLWGRADGHTLVWGLVVLLAVMTATFVFEILPGKRIQAAAGLSSQARGPAILTGVYQCVIPLLILVVLAQPSFQSRFFDDARFQPVRDALATGDSLIGEFAPRDRGYYERLTNVNEADRQLWETYTRQRIVAFYTGEDPVIPVQDFRFHRALPNVKVHAYYTDFQTNRWGMRDREYDPKKPPDTVRIAVLGASQTMGWGVRKEETFEYLLEKYLNLNAPPKYAGMRFEVLNFAFNRLSPLGQIDVLRNEVSRFGPDVIMLVTHFMDYGWVKQDLSRALQKSIPINDAFLNRIAAQARIGARTHEVIALRRLKPLGPELLEWCYQRIVSESRKMRSLPVCVFFPIPEDLPINRNRAMEITDLAARSGFSVLDLSSVFEGHDRQGIGLPDGHINSKGHAMVAEAIYRRLIGDSDAYLACNANAQPPSYIHGSLVSSLRKK